MEISGSPTEKAILSWAYKVSNVCLLWSIFEICFLCMGNIFKEAVVAVGDEV